MTETAIIIGIISIITGPLAAILISRWLDEKKIKREEQLEILKNLIAFKSQVPPNSKFFESLNLIPVVFYNQKSILKYHDDLINHLFQQRDKNSESDPSFPHISAIVFDGLYEKHLLNLLNEMSQFLGYKKLRQTDISKGIVSRYDLEDYKQREKMFGFLEMIFEEIKKEIDRNNGRFPLN